jgi:hypothetical protein
MGYGIRARALGIGGVAVLAWAGMGASHVTGVSGTVRLSPAGPGPQRAGEAGASPYRGAAVQLRDARGSIVARAIADERGQFTVAVPAGTYEVGIDVQHAAWPRCETVEATVRANRIARVAIVCDSGMR